jgi:hypothetical protein
MSETTGPVAGGPLVDCHTHVFTADMPVAGGAWIRPDYDFTGGDLIATDGRARRAFRGRLGPQHLGLLQRLHDRRAAREPAPARHRDRPPAVDRYTLERMQADGIVGIRLQLARRDSLEDFRSDDYRLLFRRVRDLGLARPGRDRGRHCRRCSSAARERGQPRDRPLRPPRSRRSAQLPGVQGDGRGGRYRALLDQALGRLPPRRPGRLAGRSDGDLEETAKPVAEALLARVGTDRLLWGSDAPFVGYEKRLTYPDVLRTYRSWVPTPGTGPRSIVRRSSSTSS